MRNLSGLSEIAGLYDGFILDLWGVVHDGVKPFPATIPALKELKMAKRKVWMLSNAPRRSYIVAQWLEEMGIDGSLYDGVMTSGEATHTALKDKYLSKWGRKCLHIGDMSRNGSLFENLDIAFVKKPEDADFVLNSGLEDFSDTAEKYAKVLQACSEKNLPMLCANPDKVAHMGDRLITCAGTLAEMYEGMDGQVVYCGKPYRAVYSACLEGMKAARVLAVGDGMQTDIAGASGMGIDSALVVTGIHRNELGGDEAADETFFARYPYRPTYLMEGLVW